MAHSYPIWTDVTACNYKGSKSFGSKETSIQDIYVGTSATNSHKLVTIKTTRRIIDDIIYFRFSYDGNIVKEIKMNKNTKEIIL